MSEKKKFVRQNATPSIEDLEKTLEQLNTKAVEKIAVKTTIYSYTIKLDEDLEKRVNEATKKHRQTKKGFFLSAIEERLEKLGF
jgi:phosphoenolpyruvate carboxylase